MNRILLYVHYNKNASLHSHVLYQLKKIRKTYSRVVFISNSHLSTEHKENIADFVDDILERENTGYDFYAWKESIDRIGYENLAHYDTVTLMNDTCFGPLCDLEAVYARMQQDPCDFWGMLNHRRVEDIIPELQSNIPEHVQSFFMVFKQTVVRSCAWSSFWEEMKCEKNVYQVIAKYETRLTEVFCAAGFTYNVLLDTQNLDLSREELSYVPADYCINAKLPLLKIKSLLQHQNPRYVIKKIGQLFEYPIDLIESYISEGFQPDKSILFCDKVLNTYSSAQLSASQSLKQGVGSVAIHVHVYYMDVWNKYVEYLQALDFSYALYVTTNSEEKSKEIRESLAGKIISQSGLKDVIVLPNRGRDILPWLSIADKLVDYDVVLHAHTKRSPTVSEWVGASWQQDIFDTMLEKASYIVSAFQENSKLGVVIPDMPSYWRYIAPVSKETEAPYIDMMNGLWRRMGCSKNVDFENALAFIMPYGTMFWYRPAALAKITSLELDTAEIPEEPLPEKTILHVIERLIVYVAWNAGFDYKIVPPKEIAPGFIDGIVRNQRKLTQINTAEIAEDIFAINHVLDIKDVNRLDGNTFFQRCWTKFKELVRPRKMVKMILPYGIIRLYQKIREKKQESVQETPPIQVQPQLISVQKASDFWLSRHRHLHPLNIVYDKNLHRSINLVITSLGRAQLFGGIATCTGIATVIARGLGLPLRIITRDASATREQYIEIMDVMGITPCPEVSFYSDSARDEFGNNGLPVHVSNNDIFLASSWWTATVLRKSIENRNVYHIIQEDELMFYPRGDDYLDCENALNAPESKYIVNSCYLHNWFKNTYPNIYANSEVFEPVFQKKIARNFQKKKKYNLFFYARLTNPRNLFWFGTKVIDECLRRGVLVSEEWDIYLAGDESIPPLEFYGGKCAINLGVMSWAEYRDFLREIDLGICLIQTPHPGYPVYDVAVAGGVALTNRLYTKNAFPCSENIIACDLSEDAFIEGLEKAVALTKDEVRREKNYLNQCIPDDWEASLSGVLEFVRKNGGFLEATE